MGGFTQPLYPEPSADAAKIQGDRVSTANPTAGQVLAWNAATELYEPVTPTVTPEASETVQGKIEIATAAEVQTGTDTARAVVPSALAAWWTWVKTQAQTIAGNWTFNGILTAPNQTDGSGSNVMTRDLADSRMPSSAFYCIRDDFTTGGTTSGTIGYLRWNLTNGTSGSISCAGASHASPRIGVVRLTTSSAASGEGGALHLAFPSSASPSSFSAFSWTLEAILAPVATTNISIRAGIIAVPQNAGNDSSSASRGVYVRYDTAAGDTNWMGVIGALNGSEVRRTVSLGVAPSAGTFVRFNIRRISATQYGFSVNGGAETTLPITAGDTNYDVAAQPCVAVTTRTTGAASCDVDFYSVYAPISR